MGHVPTFEEDPRDIIIDEPLKTTVYYGQFERINESKSYILELSTGDRLLISIITPDPSSEIKARLINPYGFDTIIPSYKAGNAVYEPFAPTYFYELAKQDQTIDRAGEYALEVTVKDGSGKIAVTFGYLEKFTLREWLGVPLKSLRIYQWTGQSWPFILAPFVLPLVIGFNLLRKRYNPIETPLTALKNLTGFIYLGSAAVMLQQMIVSLLKTGLTLQIILNPLLRGWGGGYRAVDNAHLQPSAKFQQSLKAFDNRGNRSFNLGRLHIRTLIDVPLKRLT
jgi:hypothetical protein